LPVPTPEVQKNKILRGLKWAAAAVYVQMCLGAFIRHGGQSVACGLGWDSAWKCLDGVNPEATFFPATIEAQIHMIHRLMAAVSLLVVVFGTRPFLHWARAQQLPKIRMLIIFCHFLFAVQIALGIYTIATGISFYVVTAHLFTGMLIWINIFTQNMLARELLNPETEDRASLSSLKKSYQS
jgi:heme A synthase